MQFEARKKNIVRRSYCYGEGYFLKCNEEMRHLRKSRQINQPPYI